MKRMLVALVFLGAALSLLIGTPALSSRVSGLTKAAEQHHFAPVPKTGSTYDDPSGINDDGELQLGIPWPEPRFTDNGDGTVTDNLTGLVWMKNASNGAIGLEAQEWANACAACNGLEDGENGLADGSVAGDWRLPNLRELQSLVNYGAFLPALPPGHPFAGVLSAPYWSSTRVAYNTPYAWCVNFDGGYMSYNFKSSNCYVWCVRGGP